MNEWKKITIDDVTDVLGDGLHGTPKYTENGEYAFVNGNNLVNGKLVIKKDTKRVDETQYERYKKPLSDRTIMVSINGTLGNVGVYNGEKVILGKSACYFNVKQEYDKDFIKYVVSSPLFKSYLENNSTGTTIKNISLKQMREYEFDVPKSLELQRKISSILKNIDDKIEVNEMINRNLSEQLQVVFQEYFTNETNGVLSDICEYSKARIEVEELTLESYYSTENMLPNKMGATVATSLPSTGKTPKCKKGDILISNIRPYFKKIVYCYEDAGCSSDVLCFAAKSDDLSPYLYATLYIDKFFDYMVAGSKGTKMPRGDKQQIMNYPVYVPSNEELRKFSDFAIDVLETINKNKIECHRLEEIRDSLLPKLMSGELDVSSIDI